MSSDDRVGSFAARGCRRFVRRGPPIIPIYMHGWEPIWEAVGGTCEGDCDFFPEPEDIDYEGNSRRNLRFGITGGGGCCIPWFAPGYLY